MKSRCPFLCTVTFILLFRVGMQRKNCFELYFLSCCEYEVEHGVFRSVLMLSAWRRHQRCSLSLKGPRWTGRGPHAGSHASHRASPPFCVDVDECGTDVAICPHGDVCVNTVGSYKCLPESCQEGFILNGNRECVGKTTIAGTMASPRVYRMPRTHACIQLTWTPVCRMIQKWCLSSSGWTISQQPAKLMLVIAALLGCKMWRSLCKFYDVFIDLTHTGLINRSLWN